MLLKSLKLKRNLSIKTDEAIKDAAGYISFIVQKVLYTHIKST